MTSRPAPPTQSSAVRLHLERALAESTDPEVRYHLRQALQLVI